jgi:hypothetical protein
MFVVKNGDALLFQLPSQFFSELPISAGVRDEHLHVILYLIWRL